VTVIQILVIDDDLTTREMLQLSLGKMDNRYQVSAAADGFEALDLLRDNSLIPTAKSIERINICLRLCYDYGSLEYTRGI
jgi:CheY-like chemotaxis protein